jgi:hypothetical protein
MKGLSSLVDGDSAGPRAAFYGKESESVTDPPVVREGLPGVMHKVSGGRSGFQ